MKMLPKQKRNMFWSGLIMLPIGPVFAYDDIRIISSAVAGKKKANKEASTTTLR